MLTRKQYDALNAIREIVDYHEGLWDGLPNPVQAHFLVQEVLEWTARVIGPDVINIAYGKTALDATRSDHLAALSRRLEMVAPIFRSVDPLESDGSIPKASAEIAALAAGDIPILFKRVSRGANSSEGAVAYRLAEYQARALYWGEVFKQRGVQGWEWKSWISQAYRNYEWDTIRKWKGPVQQRLPGKLETLIQSAKLSADLDRRMSREFDLEAARTALKADGAQYSRLLTLAAEAGTVSTSSYTGQDT